MGALTSDEKTGAAPSDTSAARLGYRCAASDMLHAARLFVQASGRLAAAARALDPDGTREEDPGVLALAESTADLLALAAISSPGTRMLLVEALKKAAAAGGAAAEA